MRPLLLLVLLAFCVNLAAAAELTARLDREQIADDETVGLSLILSGGGGTPDLSPLEADFDIIDQSHVSRMSFVNGQSSSSREWRLELAPRHTGLIEIPSLKVGDLASQPLTLTVLAAAKAKATAPSGDQDVRLEVSAIPEAPYVQGRVDYQVRLLARVQLLQPRLSDPTAEGAQIERVGDDQQYSEMIDGERYTVVERHYAIFPQRSGSLEIEPPRLVAAVPVERTPPAQGFGQDPFGPIEEIFGSMPGMGGMFTSTRQVRARGRSVTLDVQPQPADAEQPWLPAESLELSDEWQPQGGRVTVGEAVTRTITITAAGVTSAQLPDLDLDAPAGVKLYPDPPQSQDERRGEVPVAVKQIKVALVATSPGEVTLPEIRVPWWDTTSDSPREAVIPARTLEVVAAAGGGAGVASPAPAATPVEARPQPAAVPSGGRATNASVPAAFWPWFSALLALGWLATLGLWWRERHRRLAIPQAAGRDGDAAAPRRPLSSRAEARQAAERACRNRGPRDARDALLAWAALAWPDNPPRGLAGLAVRLDSDEAAAALTAMERGLYSEAGPTDWNGKATWAAIGPALAAYDGDDAGAPQGLALPELYPSRID
ncbi:hypothetical protein Thimo_2929 [Thioflavicoccus mobilis 8321]|uniref:DUF7939 domain-containing protein n=1 Tax=Thioflavicoccus mobilis 8321 TaxID=765912 RepID=L0H0N5_9GAMM|nr:BatD family protein [Thioflavicoccus mobilis]AGA91622.1 hypothetical protein Thimo_2929 [Thioflavicoccus mobilis 8321]